MARIVSPPMLYPFVVWNAERSVRRAFSSSLSSLALPISQIACIPTRTPKKKNAWNPISFRYAMKLLSGVAVAGRHLFQMVTIAASTMKKIPA